MGVERLLRVICCRAGVGVDYLAFLSECSNAGVGFLYVSKLALSRGAGYAEMHRDSCFEVRFWYWAYRFGGVRVLARLGICTQVCKVKVRGKG